MKNRVVCIKEGAWQSLNNNGFLTDSIKPVKGEIYTVNYIVNDELGSFYGLHGFVGEYAVEAFRPVDSTYGEVVCETIEQQIELEKVLV